MNTLVDTSVWTDHFRRGNKELIHLLERGEVWIHPLVIGEIACGNLKNRDLIIESLMILPKARTSTLEENLELMKKHKLYGKGVGIVDIEILSACHLNGLGLFTLDKRLARLFHYL